MWGFCVFGCDTVIHRTPFVVVSCGKKYNKINQLIIDYRTENPCVGGSIPPLATMKLHKNQELINSYREHAESTVGILWN